MKIALHEITPHAPLDLSFDENEKWILQSILSVDEALLPKAIAEKRSACISFKISTIDLVFIVSGKINTFFYLLCSRCAEPFMFSCNTHFSMLYCQDPIMAGVSHLSGEKFDKPTLTNHGFARHAHDEDASEMDIVHLNENFINLSDTLVEQLRLQVPFRPLCQEDCKGLCGQCAANLNRGQCACKKIKENHSLERLLKTRRSNGST